MQRNVIKVLLWSPMGVGTHYHGPAIALFRLFKGLANRYPLELHLIHANHQQDELGIFASAHALPYLTKSSGIADRLLSSVRYLRAANSWLRSNVNRFDLLVLPACNHQTLIPALRAQRRGLPVVGRVAAANAELGELSGYRRALGWSKRRVEVMGRLNAIIAISRDIERRLIELGLPQRKVVYLPNSVDCERFHPARRDERARARRRFSIPDDARFVVACVGAIGERKGQAEVARAFSRLPSDVHLLLVGPIREPRVFDEILATPSVSHRFTWSDHITDIEEAFHAGDLFLLPSTDEGMPNAMLEAMASGLPCIGTRISGINELLEDGERGMLVERSSAAIAEAIMRYVEDSRLVERHGRAAREYVEQGFSSEKAAEMMYALICEISGVDRLQC